jgi:outer membrane protein OmpA-like peptidoglycan-associated protein
MTARKMIRPILAVSLLLTGWQLAIAQDALRETFFKDADEALAVAREANAEFLAPRSFERGQKAYEAAEQALERGRNIDTVRNRVAEAQQHFAEAARSAELARTALAQALKSRDDGNKAGAPGRSKPLWDDAQETLGEAIRYLERGDLKAAKDKEIAAISLYRDAELGAIKSQYLSDTRRLLDDADRARVGRYAPVTLEKARQLLAQAERELNENRYDTDLPRSLAQQANYEARHAIYLADIVGRIRDKELTAEELVLDWEKPLQRVSGAADIVPAMANGPGELTDRLVDFIENLRSENQQFQQEISENQVRLADMEAEISALDEKLGGATAERAALVQRLEAQARVKAQFEEVEKIFTRDEARVLREGNNIILRLVGLTFDSGQSAIKPENFDLLAKVEKAIDIFPRSDLLIEGHTDSYGSDDLNMRLSQARAEAVRQYMISAMGIQEFRTIATGYGETNPVANNETEEGRARNRRIDILIRPNLD